MKICRRPNIATKISTILQLCHVKHFDRSFFIPITAYIVYVRETTRTFYLNCHRCMTLRKSFLSCELCVVILLYHLHNLRNAFLSFYFTVLSCRVQSHCMCELNWRRNPTQRVSTVVTQFPIAPSPSCSSTKLLTEQLEFETRSRQFLSLWTNSPNSFSFQMFDWNPSAVVGNSIHTDDATYLDSRVASASHVWIG